MHRAIIAAAVVAVALTLAPPASATAPDTHRVTICHATGSDTNPYNKLSPDIASSGYLKAGHSAHEDDIIPPYTYVRADGSVFVFEGQGDQSILAADCNVPVDPPTCEELDNCPPPPCEGDDCNPPPPPRPEKARYRVVRRMPSVRVKSIKFLADATARIWCHDTSATVVLRVGKDAVGLSIHRLDARNGNMIRVKTGGETIARERCK